MSAHVFIGLPSELPNFESTKVVGHVLVAVIHAEDGSLAIERCVGVNIDDFPEDGETVTAFIQSVEKKLNEALPEPEIVPTIWIPE